MGDTVIYMDHGVRLLWQARGRNVWFEPPPRRDVLARLVRLTKIVAAPN